jgi:hypothetical protein
MALADDIGWFKRNFGGAIDRAVEGTLLTPDLLCAIALQETGYLWRRMRAKGLPPAEILRLCVGDTIDAPSRRAFPADKAQLLAQPKGRRMFDLGHAALVEMGAATGLPEYIAAGRKPDEFCRGYGIFQRDLQFFKDDPDYFLERRWADFDRCLAEAVKELKKGVDKLGYETKARLSDAELCNLAIVYNTGFGNFKASKGLKQGYKDGNGVYYGEHIAAFLKKAGETRAPSPDDEGEGEGLAAADGDGAGRSLVPRPAASPTIVDVARRELLLYGGIYEGNEPLESHIDAYWRAAKADPSKFSATGDAWSAAFISFCVQESGVASGDFAFSTQHSRFVHAAIRNAEANKGTFRAHPITAYAPKLGDIIQNNRLGNRFDFAHAKADPDYPSHTAIVVDFEVRGGVRYAVTIGGNEENTVGRRRVPLQANGLVRQAPGSRHYICVIENRSAGGDVSAPRAGRFRVAAKPDLNLRPLPTTARERIRALPFGAELQVVDYAEGEAGTWALVDVDGDGGRDGYVFASYLVPA